MIEEINRSQRRRFRVSLGISIIVSVVTFLLSLMIGHYGFISFEYLVKLSLNVFGAGFVIPKSYGNIIQYIRLPRTIASFIVGGALSLAGLVYQNTFNNKLISPDILGVSAGACVGAGLAILIGLNGFYVSIFAFAVGFLSVIVALFLPVVFKNRSTITLVLSGIIVGAFMNSIIGLIKYLADREEKLAAITFWIMGSVTGVTMREVFSVLPLVIVPCAILVLMSHRIDVISLGQEEAESLGINYRRNRFIIIVCSTVLTAASVSISGNVGWIGLVIPHIVRAIVGNRSRDSLPIAFFFGGSFMALIDMLSRTLAKDDIPLSILTGIFGAVIYSVVLMKKGRNLND